MTALYSSKSQAHGLHTSYRFYTSLITFTAILVLTGLAMMFLHQQNQIVNQQHFDNLKEKLEHEIKRRIKVYRYGLMGTKGTFIASTLVTRREFQHMIENRDMKDEFPAATGIGYIQHIPKDEIQEFLTITRRDNIPDFELKRLKKEMTEPDYMVIKYIEPCKINHQAIGMDIGSEKNRREAAELAMNTGEITLTKVITLIQADKEGPGFLILLPIYDNEQINPKTVALRQKHITGWVYMTILAERMFQGISKTVDCELDFEVFDDTKVNTDLLLYDDDGHLSLPKESQDNMSQQLAEAVRIKIGGRQWTITMRTTQTFKRVSSKNIWLAGALGIGLAVMMTSFLHIQNIAVQRAQKLAKSMTIDLQNNMEELSHIMREKEKALMDAEHANQAKSDFLAIMSHEIRTPMNGIMGMASLMLESELTSEQQIYTQTIMGSSEALLTIINDILDYSKIEAGKLELEHIDFNLHQTLNEVIDLLQFMAKRQKITLNKTIDPAVPKWVNGDSIRTRQIIMNLMNNAIKFTEQGSVSLEIQLPIQTEKGILIHFAIKDTGLGIPEDKQSKLFDKFSQVDTSTTRQYGGSGLGLAICKQLSEMMGGQIGVESQANQGSTFWFTICYQLAQAEHHSKPQKKTPLLANCLNANVLIVDDNQINRMVAYKMLTKMGIRADMASGGKTALEKAMQVEYNLILMDCQMPDMDGYETTQKIRQMTDSKTPTNVSIIALTANAMQSDRDKCLAAGMDDFLAKPITLQTLNTTVSKWLKDSKKEAA